MKKNPILASMSAFNGGPPPLEQEDEFLWPDDPRAKEALAMREQLSAGDPGGQINLDEGRSLQDIIAALKLSRGAM